MADSYSYDAYGNTTSSSGTVANQFRYAGEYQDAESNLYYLRARYYDPATQQFLTVDLLVGWTQQEYAYVRGSPLNGIDPSGLDRNCGLVPDPTNPNSCISEGFSTTAGKIVVGIGVVVGGAVVVACFATGVCEVAAGGAFIGGASAGAASEEQSIQETVTQGSEAAGQAAEEACAMDLPAPRIGDKLFRVWGGKSKPWGPYWTRIDPRTVANYPLRAGLGPWNAGRFVSEGYLTNLWGVTQTPGGAAGYNGVGGGLDEVFVLFPELSIALTRVSGANPPYTNFNP